jgi:membrane protein implicated in regulation of membrane protease activity
MAAMTIVDKVFLSCAVLGGALFIVRVALFFIGHAGGDTDTSFDTDADVHVELGADADGGDLDVHGETFGHDVVHHGGGESDASFKLLTFQGITAFLMMFGLVGLAMHLDSGSGEPLAILAGFAAGMLALFVVAKLFAFMKGMQSSGTVDVRNAIGQQGSVYLTIPAGGTGEVQVAVQERLRIYEAKADSGEEIRTGQNVRVVNVMGGNILVVQKQ